MTRDARPEGADPVLVAFGLLPLIAALGVGAGELVGHGLAAGPPADDAAGRLLDAYRQYCRPEPGEMLGYVLGSALACAGFLAFSSRFDHLRAALGAFFRPVRVLAGIALGGGFVLVVGAHFGGRHQNYLAAGWGDAFAAAAFALGMLFVARRAPSATPRGAGAAATVAVALLAAWTLVQSLIPGVAFTRVLSTTAFHLPYSLAEFVAPAAGRTALVDFHPQYVSLLPLPFAPLLRPPGDVLWRFTALAAALSFASLAAWWWAVRSATRSAFAASVALALVLLVTYDVPDPEDFPVFRNEGSIFQYFAIAPLRLTLPALGLPVVLGAVRRGSARAWLAAGVVAGLAALNNLDFGAVFAGVTVVVAVLFGRPGGLSNRNALVTLGGVAAGVLAGMVLLALHAGAWPSLHDSLEFQRVFAAAGFFLEPLPLGDPMPYLVFATHLAAIATGLLLRARGGEEARVRAALLVLAGLNGLGTGMYFVGRSLPPVLEGLFLYWAFSTALLALEAFRAVRTAAPRASGWTTAAALLVAFQCGLYATRVHELDRPARHLAKLAPGEDRHARWFGELAKAVRDELPAGAATDIVYPEAHLLALEAGVDNRFEFAHTGSLISLAQVDSVARQIARLQPARVFGDFPPELAARLREMGYERRRVVAQTNAPLRLAALPDFEIWARGGTEERTP